MAIQQDLKDMQTAMNMIIEKMDDAELEKEDQLGIFLNAMTVSTEEIVEDGTELIRTKRALPTEAEKKSANTEVKRCHRFLMDWIKKYHAAMYRNELLSAPELNDLYRELCPGAAMAEPKVGSRRGNLKVEKKPTPEEIAEFLEFKRRKEAMDEEANDEAMAALDIAEESKEGEKKVKKAKKAKKEQEE